jgi:Transposase DDE domain
VDANRTEAWLREQVETILAEARRVDEAEDAEHGDRRGDEPPEEFADPRARAEKIRAALAEIDADRAAAARAREQAAAERLAQLDNGPGSRGQHRAEVEVTALRRRLERLIAGQQARLDAYAAKVAAAEAAGPRRPRGKHPSPVEEHSDIVIARSRLAAAEARAAERAHRQAEKAAAGTVRGNLTDPGSRLMPTRRGWVQGYNVQIANVQIAAAADQLIVATGVGQQTGDRGQFVPMAAAAEQAAADCRQASGRAEITIGVALADAGYFSEANLTAPGPDRLIALGKGSRQHNDALRRPAAGQPPPGATPREAMDHRLRTAEGARLYKRRGATVEPAIGNLKKILPRFSRRGLAAAAAAIDLAAAAFNLLKIHRAGPATA